MKIKNIALILSLGFILTGCGTKTNNASLEQMKTQLAAQEILLQAFQQQITTNTHNINVIIQKVDPEAAKQLAEQIAAQQAEIQAKQETNLENNPSQE